MTMSSRWSNLAGVAVLCVALGMTGCEDEVDQNGLDAGGDDVGHDIDDGEFDCEPGQIVACAGEEQSGIEICNGAGDGTEASECAGSSICRNERCIDVNCQPGSGRCLSDSEPQTCVPDGDGDYEYVDAEDCAEGETCELGQCLDRCGVAELTDSYVGCEYWAVETENVLLHSETDGTPTVDAEHRPPFAVVLANTEADVNAYVTVEGADGEIAEAVGAREVHSNRINPGDEWVTVHSETVDQQGNRIGDPHDGPIEDVELPPGATLTLLLPNRDIPFGETTVTPSAYRIETTQPVVAYQFNPFCCNYNYTNDASLLLPSSALTENYMMVSHAVWAGGALNRLPEPYSPTLVVVAMEDDTTVEVQLRATEDEDQDFEDQLYPVREGDGISGPDSSGRLTVNLDKHEVFNVSAGGAKPVVDISGARVTADKNVAAFGAHSCTFVPFTKGACDHIESQLFPLETWATSFVVAPHKMRNPDPDANFGEGTYWKFVARDDNTRITTDISVARGDVLPPSGEGVPHCGDYGEEPGEGEFYLDAGQFCEFGTSDVFEAQATRPISIAGFMSSQNTVFDQVNWGDHAGDPSMFLVPPRDQYRTSYTFLTPPTYHVSYITVVMPPGHPMTLDGETIDPMEHDHELVSDGTMLMAHIEVEPGPHNVSANIPFGLVVYGFDNYVSYSYTGGLDLTKLNPLSE